MNRPDLQWTDSEGIRHYWEIDTNKNSSVRHGEVIKKNDPMVLYILKHSNRGEISMNLKFSVFFDITVVDDFFDSVIFSTASKKNCMQSYKSDKKPTLSEITNIMDCVRIIYKNNKSLIIYEDNLIDGGWTYINTIAKKFDIKTLYVRIKDEQPFPAYYLAYFENNAERIIYNIKENRWKFFKKGPVAFFEEDEKYLENKVADKFNKEKILLFCQRLGIDVLNEQFFVPVSPVYCMQRRKD